jgi:sugar-specific transcriptional regulator TrmB
VDVQFADVPLFAEEITIGRVNEYIAIKMYILVEIANLLHRHAIIFHNQLLNLDREKHLTNTSFHFHSLYKYQMIYSELLTNVSINVKTPTSRRLVFYFLFHVDRRYLISMFYHVWQPK